MMKISSHPENALIRAFAAGELTGPTSLALSAHIDMCARCQDLLAKEEARLAGAMLGGELPDAAEPSEAVETILDMQLQQMMESIMQQPALRDDVPTRQAAQPLVWQGREFHLPRALQRYVEKTERWRRLGGKLWRANVSLGGEASASFIYMKDGGSIPAHTHKGQEITLVLDGKFCDESGRYGPGDIIMRDAKHEHTPYTDDKDGCLCFAIEAPLHFTKGLPRLMNPISHLFN